MPFLLIVSFGCLCSSLTLRIIDPVVPALARDLGQPVATVAMLTSAYAFPYALGQPFFGALGDALGKARIIKICYVALTLLTAIAAFAPDLESLMGLRLLAGLAAGGIVPLAYAMVADRVPVNERAAALAQLMMSGFLAQIFGLVATGLIGDAFGWRAVIAATAALLAIACLTLLLMLKARPNQIRPPLTLGGALSVFPRILRRRHALLCYGGSALEGMCVLGITPYIAVLLERDGFGSVREAGFVLAGLGAGGIAFALAIRWLLKACGGGAGMTRLGGLLSACGFAGVAVAGSWPQYAIGLTVAGIGFYMTHNALVTCVAELDAENRGATMALFAFSFFTGQAAGPPLFALGLATIGSGPTFIIVGLLLFGLSLRAAAVLPARPSL